MAPKSRVCGVLVTGLLASFEDLYRLALLEKGYTPLTAVNQLRQVARLSRWLEADGVTAGACRRAGIVEVGSHRLRHTMACEMIAADVPLVEIAQVLRHSSLQSTAVYANPQELHRTRTKALVAC
jgi:integrase